MKGFIRNYAAQKQALVDPAKIMESLTPKTVPVFSSLAHHYAVCDRCFDSIPSQTFCDRPIHIAAWNLLVQVCEVVVASFVTAHR
jgi:phospholipase C